MVAGALNGCSSRYYVMVCWLVVVVLLSWSYGVYVFM